MMFFFLWFAKLFSFHLEISRATMAMSADLLNPAVRSKKTPAKSWANQVELPVSNEWPTEKIGFQYCVAFIQIYKGFFWMDTWHKSAVACSSWCSTVDLFARTWKCEFVLAVENCHWTWVMTKLAKLVSWLHVVQACTSCPARSPDICLIRPNRTEYTNCQICI